MGRGLSELQKYILKRAARSNDTCRAEILCGFFGWPSRRSRPPRPGEKTFRPARIGEVTYRSANASLSRAWRRLRDRGLMEQSGYLTLTDQGRDLVRSWGIEPVPPRPPGPSLEELTAAILSVKGVHPLVIAEQQGRLSAPAADV
jgi:hypothetical protein